MTKIAIISLALALGACSLHLPAGDPVQQHLADNAMRIGRLEKAIEAVSAMSNERFSNLERALVDVQKRSISLPASAQQAKPHGSE